MLKPQRDPRAPDRSGLTLVELLVVIAAVGILLAVLLPGLSHARRLTKRRVCQANLRQIAQAWQMYLNDNEGHFLQGINASVTNSGDPGSDPSAQDMRRPLNQYLKEVKVCRCPTDDGGLIGQGVPFYDQLGTSYQTNVLLVGQDQKGWLPEEELLTAINARLRNLTINAVSNPSKLLLVGDFGWANCWEPDLPRVGDWHGRRCHHNLAYLDGHVAFLHIRKGMYVMDDYTVLPFQELRALARGVQQERPCED